MADEPTPVPDPLSIVELEDLKGELEQMCPHLCGRIWYDKDQDPSVEQMRLGVRRNKYFLLYLTEGVLLREFCRKEIRWALHYRKNIVLVWKQQGAGVVASARHGRRSEWGRAGTFCCA